MNVVEQKAFLNLDLELRSREDLTPLATYFENRALVLFNGFSNDIFQLTVEPLIGGLNESPQACTEELLQTISKLPVAHMKLFRDCDTRMFDYGFERCTQAPPVVADILATQLSKMSLLGIDLRVTIYPQHADSPEREIVS